MLGRSTVLPCSTPSTGFTASSTLRQPCRPALRGISAAHVTDTPRPKANESNGSRNGDGKVGEGGPTIINGQVRAALSSVLSACQTALYCAEVQVQQAPSRIFLLAGTHVHPRSVLIEVTLPFVVQKNAKAGLVHVYICSGVAIELRVYLCRSCTA